MILDKPKESYEGISEATADTLCIPSPPGDLDRHILDHNSQSYGVLLLRGALSLLYNKLSLNTCMLQELLVALN